MHRTFIRKVKLIVLFLSFVIGINTIFPPPVYAKTVNLESHLTQEQIQSAKTYAERISAEAKKKARASGAYDYDVGRIVRTVIFSIFTMAVIYAFDLWFKKRCIARIWIIRLFSYFMYSVLSILMMLFNILVIR